MDKYYMKKALELAKKGKGKVSPNPMVGAIIVKNKNIIGQGYHQAYGKAHAEVNAFENAIEDVRGASMYVTLEPCNHYGRTPPCVDKIIEKGISRLVIASFDPNPLTAGKGVKKLIDCGIKVTIGILEKESKKLNEIFFKYIVEKKPFVVMKTAMSLDGKIATKTGESKWITGAKSRENVHKLRGELSSILVGVNTVIVDDPSLTCRIKNGKNPIRIIVDSKLRIPINSKVLKNQKQAKTIIATTESADMKKKLEIENKGVKVLIIKTLKGRVDLRDLMSKLAWNKIDSILIEGGGTLNYSALEQAIVDKIQIYIGTKLIGGEKAKTPVEGVGIEHIKNAFQVQNMTYKILGEDLLIEGYIRGEKKCSQV